MSRLDGKVWAGKPLLLLSTSPGSRGGATVLAIAAARFPFDGADVVASFSLPQFRINFHQEEGIRHPELRRHFGEALNIFRARLHE
jgi:hypothetical protein